MSAFARCPYDIVCMIAEEVVLDHASKTEVKALRLSSIRFAYTPALLRRLYHRGLRVEVAHTGWSKGQLARYAALSPWVSCAAFVLPERAYRVADVALHAEIVDGILTYLQGDAAVQAVADLLRVLPHVRRVTIHRQSWSKPRQRGAPSLRIIAGLLLRVVVSALARSGTALRSLSLDHHGDAVCGWLALPSWQSLDVSRLAELKWVGPHFPVLPPGASITHNVNGTIGTLLDRCSGTLEFVGYRSNHIPWSPSVTRELRSLHTISLSVGTVVDPVALSALVAKAPCLARLAMGPSLVSGAGAAGWRYIWDMVRRQPTSFCLRIEDFEAEEFEVADLCIVTGPESRDLSYAVNPTASYLPPPFRAYHMDNSRNKSAFWELVQYINGVREWDDSMEFYRYLDIPDRVAPTLFDEESEDDVSNHEDSHSE